MAPHSQATPAAPGNNAEALEMGNKPVRLMRPTLDGVPDIPLPAPYRLRWYRPGDTAAWVAIHREADAYNVATETLFRQQFGNPDARELPLRQCYALDAKGRPAGTVTAWFDVGDADLGRIHWLAVMPSHQRRGIGRALLAAACRRLRELGHRRVYLMTSTARLGAIRLYRQFGFVPQPRLAEEQRLWQVLERTLAAGR